MDEPPPPWIAIPTLRPDDPATQGEAEAYLVLEWLPFWSALDAPRKAAYLDRWRATPEWRDAIALRFDRDGFDLEEDLRESEEMLKRRRAEETDRPSWSRWLRRP